MNTKKLGLAVLLGATVYTSSHAAQKQYEKNGVTEIIEDIRDNGKKVGEKHIALGKEGYSLFYRVESQDEFERIENTVTYCYSVRGFISASVASYIYGVLPREYEPITTFATYEDKNADGVIDFATFASNVCGHYVATKVGGVSFLDVDGTTQTKQNAEFFDYQRQFNDIKDSLRIATIHQLWLSKR